MTDVLFSFVDSDGLIVIFLRHQKVEAAGVEITFDGVSPLLFAWGDIDKFA